MPIAQAEPDRLAQLAGCGIEQKWHEGHCKVDEKGVQPSPPATPETSRPRKPVLDAEGRNANGINNLLVKLVKHLVRSNEKNFEFWCLYTKYYSFGFLKKRKVLGLYVL